MRTRLGYLLLFLGLAALVVQTVNRLNRERQFYEIQLRQQADSIESGLKEKWRAHLLALVRSDQLPKDFVLRWDREGRAMQTRFYPDPGMQLNWEEYREATRTKNLARQKSFLNKALELKWSWDRVLALEEWRTLIGEFPKLPTEGYEKTVVDPEAREAYGAVLSEVDSGRDFTFAGEKPELGHAFFRSIGTQELEVFLPSIASVQLHALPDFIKQNRLENAAFGKTSLDIQFPYLMNLASKGFNSSDTLILGLSTLLLAAGVGLTVSSLHLQRRLLSRRVSFLNQVVHELKTPLAGLKLNAQLIRRSGASEKNLKAIDESVSRLDRLFDDIVQVNRSETKAELENLPPETLLDLVLALAREFAEDRVDVKSSLQSPVFSELGRLRILLRNLIANGVKYGEHVHIEISEVTDAVSIRVRDEGPGVPLQDAKKIFDEFFRSEQARKTKVDGLGLGLPLVKKLAREIGAEVRLNNPGSSGAEFEVVLPTARKGKSS